MAAVWWLLLFGTALSYTVMAEEQPATMEEIQSEENQELDSILQRAHGVLIRNILRRIEEGAQNDGDVPVDSLEWISRHQHPGKILQESIEKRQHPGKREDGDLYLELPKRQHPGKREDGEWYLELPKRQHPGRRSPLSDQYLDNPSTSFGLLSELTKRQHPGKRSFPYTKRQHPGKRMGEDEENTKDGVPQDIEKRQHPGKRYLEPNNIEYLSPCEGPDLFNCNKRSLLMEILDNVSGGRLEEKRQHPGRRDVWGEEVNDAQE
ncbi:pro-thyrotropin-releasing hormone-A-like [Bombina bombina]|uniref:pro-thyrotropin-releasing hormone-A-like n=1 Tax=Bombina bombina TaxID=8345 RepID=UPI00235A7118|nr:pro-thyrotropin-releasing hormone-A-like [Bombina bombina]